ncbi:unnamed protein product [Clonostachys rosea]|uniref:Rhodopsin domain-containing protein n=1 Tax=Bionectria ochroleuca TaxID=29856 RepID=A0ABY6UQU0_BIOOC|nr:unnamed protein product [Clonostachys rosea]
MSSARDAYYPVGITFMVVNAVAVGLRFWARGIKSAVGYDDVAMAVSFVGFVIFVAFELVAIDNGIGATVMEPTFDLIKAAKFFTIAQIVYILTTGISKLGVALVLYRLSDRSDLKQIRLVLIVSMVIVTLWCFATALLYALQCRPLSVAWGVGEGTCISSTVLGNAGIALSAQDVAASWLYGLLPVYMLRKAQLRMKVKVTVMFLLGLGAVSSVATIIRLKFVVDVTRIQADGGLASASIIQKTLEATIYSILEIGLSILAAALTALRPLLKKVPCFSDISSGGYSGSKALVSSRSGNRDHIKGPPIRLDDMHTSAGDSDENFAAPRRVMGIKKDQRIEVGYEPRDPTKVQREQW